jgi:flagellar biosynthesis anti-sigma factor FlgM
MSNSISSLNAGQIATETAAPDPVAPRPAAASAAAAAGESEAVTLSPTAQAAAQLLSAAQASEGVDAKTVSLLKAALQDGSYNVSPDDLAQAIATVLKETP